ncbi:DUF6308 family protein [Paenarthrobacter sp. NPDC057981]|uniref:DUF6308 family protein n=1 Tax=Paenarthrobacter sp. NPDC057981 TaxID=3346297 RepID=UPI0036DCDA2F
MTKLRVGGASVGFDEAKTWAYDYLANDKILSAYPAYDGYPGSPTPTLGPQDLLAPALLNVSQNPVPAYYGLEALMGPLNDRLEALPAEADLATADSETISRLVNLLGVLEEQPTKYVKLVTLSKVLHRKRPKLIPLFDAHIYWCYTLRPEAPLPEQRGRSRAEYRSAWLTAVQKDLHRQLEQWNEIAGIAPGPQITPLRALDIIGWELGKRRM